MIFLFARLFAPHVADAFAHSTESPWRFGSITRNDIDRRNRQHRSANGDAGIIRAIAGQTPRHDVMRIIDRPVACRRHFRHNRIQDANDLLARGLSCPRHDAVLSPKTAFASFVRPFNGADSSSNWRKKRGSRHLSRGKAVVPCSMWSVGRFDPGQHHLGVDLADFLCADV